MRRLLVLFFGVGAVCATFAQEQSRISAKVLDAKTLQPIVAVVVSIQNTNFTQLSNAQGVVIFEAIPAADYLVLFHSQGYKDALFTVSTQNTLAVDLGTVLLELDQITDQQAAIVQIFDEDLADDNSSSESTSGLLQSSKDAFQQAAAFNWGQARFRIRGLDSENAITMLNGIAMNKIYDRRPNWNNWGGLNDATRNQELSIGTTPSDYTFGGILGAQQINTRASVYRAGSRITFSGTNTNYRWRAMATYASGMGKSGWAYVVSAGKRYAQEGHFEGTNYDANSLFISIEKKLNTKHSLNFTGIYTPNERGKNSPNTAEVTLLTSETYNSYWGYQNGKIRNSRVKTVEEPMVMLNHYFKINDHTNLNSAVLYQFGKIANSNIDYQNANSPDPTYYRKMPSYYSSMYAPDNGEFSGDFIPDYENAEKSRLAFLANPQID